MKTKTRQIAKRRDRRKAKASGWTRSPKRKIGTVSHGETGNIIVYGTTKKKFANKEKITGKCELIQKFYGSYGNKVSFNGEAKLNMEDWRNWAKRSTQ